MGREAFGRYAEQRREALGMGKGDVATRLVLASGGKYFDTTSVRNIEEGKREITDDLYEWLIVILSMDRDEAHTALWPLPEGITVEDIKELRRDSERLTTRRMAAQTGSHDEGAYAAASGSLSDQGKATKLYSPVSAPEPAAA
jgi:hypothetical protein